ncbi:nucleolar complex protein 14 [Diatrype stigma]|uniref:Nucleolar complex protein 14 n=1 Tax=Diatrype stigma TaxID=117547 RepID=A0AAN9V0M5_9PEZI
MARRQTLLVEMNRRNKVGGILDRRFGENDPTMAPEDKMLERFAQEKQRSHKKSMFDLEDDEVMGGLTHLGQSISFDESAMIDDYDEEDAGAESGEDASDSESRGLKRMRPHDAEGGELGAADGEPERKKSKQEVMKELIAKSKFYKYERQQAKDDDEDLREELDKEFRDIQSLLFNRKADTATGATGATGAAGAVEDITAAEQKEKLERQYDMRLRQLALDRRAQPTDRTKTEEEEAEEKANKLKDLELKRLRRMEGQQESEDEEDGDNEEQAEEPNDGIQFMENEEEDQFGLGAGNKARPSAAELGFDDEDDFFIEDDLIASGSDLEPVESDDSGDEADSDAEDDDDFTRGLLNEQETNNPVFSNKLHGLAQAEGAQNDADGLPYTFPCPETLEELVQVTTAIPIAKVATVVQRIRALYHPKLDSSNKPKLGNFAKTLVQYIAHLSNLPQLPPFSVVENIIRHIHSLAKSYPIEVSSAFRTETEELARSRRLSPNMGDLVVLTAIGIIFPTS